MKSQAGGNQRHLGASAQGTPSPLDPPGLTLPAEPDRIEGATKAAVVLLALGPEVAAELVRLLRPSEVQCLAEHLALARHLTRDRVAEVLREFRESTQSQTLVVFDTEEFMQEVLSRSFGVEAGASLLERLEAAIEPSGIEALQALDGDWIHEQIKTEHPQIIATILALLEAKKASEVVAYFPAALRNELLLRLALLEKLQPVALKALNAVLLALASGEDSRRPALGGIRPAADIVHRLPEGMDDGALERVRQHDPALAERLIENMFRFEDIATLEERSIQTLLGELAQDQLTLALRGSSAHLRERILANLPRRSAESIREALQLGQPVKANAVREAQLEILALGRALHAQKKIVLARQLP